MGTVRERTDIILLSYQALDEMAASVCQARPMRSHPLLVGQSSLASSRASLLSKGNPCRPSKAC
jgi:hypothetical protein